MKTEKELQLQKTKERMDHLAWLLDDCFRVPGLNWRFGIESIVGLIPWAGDLLTAVLALFLLIRAFQFRLPRIVIARMLLNTFLDLVVGAVPLLGDLFDFAWKSNSKNMRLFHLYSGEPGKSTVRHWIFLAVLIFGSLAAFGGLTVLIIYFFNRLLRGLQL